MDVLPAHLNRDSFRDSFKGLVALEIILDLPFGFPINNIISLRHVRQIAEAQIGEGVADMVKFKAEVNGHEATEKANRIQA